MLAHGHDPSNHHFIDKASKAESRGQPGEATHPGGTDKGRPKEWLQALPHHSQLPPLSQFKKRVLGDGWGHRAPPVPGSPDKWVTLAFWAGLAPRESHRLPHCGSVGSSRGLLPPIGQRCPGPLAKQGRRASVDVWESQKEEKTAELAERGRQDGQTR